MPEESRTPDFARLVADLKVLREKGLTQVRRMSLHALEEATALCQPDATSLAATQPAIEELLRIALSKIGGGFLGEAAEYTFGLAKGTRAWPAQQRRRKAAEICGVTTDHFRKSYEITIFEQVAEEILAYVAGQSPSPARVQEQATNVSDATDVISEWGDRATAGIEEQILMRAVIGEATFIERLAEATSATIVDPTNEDLADHLEKALKSPSGG